MNNRRQWNMDQYCFNNQMNRMQHRNKFQHNRYQHFPPNFNRQWNSSIDFEADRYQPEFRHKRGMNRQQFRVIANNGNNNMRRRSFGDQMGRRNSWVLEDENCFVDPAPIKFLPLHQERKPFHRESSLPPVISRNRIHEHKKTEFFDKRSEDDFSIPFKRTIRTDRKSDHMTWSDSESDSKDASWTEPEVECKPEEKTEKTLKILHKDEQKLISMIWSDDSDNEDRCIRKNDTSSQKGRGPFKYTTKSIPRYDGKNLTGEEGVFEIKVYQCSFCNIICLDKEKSKAHIQTRYHYKRYKKELEKYEEETESENANEE